MNRAIEQARLWRGSPQKIAPSALHAIAKQDAGEILERLEGVTAEMPEARILHDHLTVGELAATIYRHALIECGAVEDASSGKPFDPCPVCGYKFP